MQNYSSLGYILVAGLLAGCGGSSAGGSMIDEVPPSSDIVTITVDDSDNSIDVGSGTLNENDDRARVLGQDGDLIESDLIVLDSRGGRVTLDQAGNADSAFMTIELVNPNAPKLGILGEPTAVANVPSSGSATYSGSARLNAIASPNPVDGLINFDLAGDLSVSADFASGNINIAISDMTGTSSNGFSAPQSVTDAGDLSITGASLQGSRLSGGTADLSGSSLGLLSGSVDLTHQGSLFGGDASEIGGAFTVNDRANGDILIKGAYLGD